MNESLEEKFLLIPDWTVYALGLSGSQKEVFSLIYAFSKKPNEWFTGSIEYASNRLGLCRGSITAALTKLIAKKLIIRQECNQGFVKFCRYAYNRELVSRLISEDHSKKISKEKF